VLDWNERLVYRGTRDTTLPPDVLYALDNYLHNSNPKLLVLQPLRDFCKSPREDANKERFLVQTAAPHVPTSLFDRLRRRIGGAF